jgi:hypothetical protein
MMIHHCVSPKYPLMPRKCGPLVVIHDGYLGGYGRVVAPGCLAVRDRAAGPGLMPCLEERVTPPPPGHADERVLLNCAATHSSAADRADEGVPPFGDGVPGGRSRIGVGVRSQLAGEGIRPGISAPART